jgi:hypothetical protein
MQRRLDAILARTIAFVESFAAAQVYGSESRPVAGATARRGLKVGAGRSGGFAEHCSAPAKPVGYAEPTVGGRRFRLCGSAGRPQAAASWVPALRVPALRVPLLRGRARPLAKLADAEKAGIVVGQRQRTAPVTAPRGGVRQIGSGLWPACLTWRDGDGCGRPKPAGQGNAHDRQQCSGWSHWRYRRYGISAAGVRVNLPFQRVETDSGGRPDPANSGQSSCSSIAVIGSACVLVSRRSIGGTDIPGLNSRKERLWSFTAL